MAYGARLESVLGESPRGFESPILRHLRQLGPNRFSFPAEALLQQIREKAFGAAASNRAGSRNIGQ